MNIPWEWRFWARVEKTDGCWLWRGGSTKPRRGAGYGQFTLNHRKDGAHRISWQIANGPVPDGMCVLHTCDNPPCVNPAHLYLGTMQDNINDRERRRRSKQRGSNHTNAKFNELVVAHARSLYHRNGPFTARELARILAVSETNIWVMLIGRTWKHVAPLAPEDELPIKNASKSELAEALASLSRGPACPDGQHVPSDFINHFHRESGLCYCEKCGRICPNPKEAVK